MKDATAQKGAKSIGNHLNKFHGCDKKTFSEYGACKKHSECSDSSGIGLVRGLVWG